MDDKKNQPQSVAAWRILAYLGVERIDLEGRGAFDELVIDEWLHLEQMDNGVWWLRVGDARIAVSVVAGHEPVVDVCRGFYAPRNGTSTEHEQACDDDTGRAGR